MDVIASTAAVDLRAESEDAITVSRPSLEQETDMKGPAKDQ
jgi:hypothetical protein